VASPLYSAITKFEVSSTFAKIDLKNYYYCCPRLSSEFEERAKLWGVSDLDPNLKFEISSDSEVPSFDISGKTL
jgi:hypothetical protein